MKKLVLVICIILMSGCSTLPSGASKELLTFCWERGFEFTYVDDWDEGCFDPIAQRPIRIARIKWLEERRVVIEQQPVAQPSRITKRVVENRDLNSARTPPTWLLET
jgi:hypothetical protein